MMPSIPTKSSARAALAVFVSTALSVGTWSRESWQCLETKAESVRYLRDPDGETSHAVIVLRLTMQRVTP